MLLGNGPRSLAAVGLIQLLYFKALIFALTYSRKQCTTAFVGLIRGSGLLLVVFGKDSGVGHAFLRWKPQLFES